MLGYFHPGVLFIAPAKQLISTRTFDISYRSNFSHFALRIAPKMISCALHRGFKAALGGSL